MNKKTKVDRIKFFKMILLVILITVFMQVAIPMLFVDLPSIFLYILIVVVGQIINLFIQINIHELGHLIVGKLLGYELIMFYLGPLHFDKRNGKFKFSLSFGLSTYGGLCGMRISSLSTKNQHIAYFAGGIVMNTIALIVFIVLAFYSNDLVRNLIIFPSIFTDAILIINNLAPKQVNNMYTDGKLIQAFRTGDELSKTVIDVMNLNVSISDEVRPRDLVFNDNVPKEIDQYYLSLKLYEYYHFLDLGDYNNAKESIKIIIKYRQKLNSLIYDAIIQEVIFYYSILDYNAIRANKYFNQIKKNILVDPDIASYRTLAAYYSNVDYDKALEYIDKAYLVKDEYDVQSFIKMEERLLYLVKQRIIKNVELSNFDLLMKQNDNTINSKTLDYVLGVTSVVPKTLDIVEEESNYQTILFKKKFLKIKVETDETKNIIKKRYENMLYDLVKESANYIKTKTDQKPLIAIVLGSGLDKLVDDLENKVEIPYKDIPNFPSSNIKGHKDMMIFGTLEGTPLLCMAGRYHYYEGLSMKEVTYPEYVIKELGIKSLILTNACGGINRNFTPGDIVVIDDFINGTSLNPLIGDNDERFGTRFPDMTEPYSNRLMDIVNQVALDSEISLQKGCYALHQGPYYETKAEIRAYDRMGADAIGMSTVPETIVANYLGMEVMGLGVVTNMATGIAKEKHSHEEVLEIANKAAKNLEILIRKAIKEI